MVYMYMGETGRRFETSQKENKKDMKQLGVKYTRARRKESLVALTDHVASKNIIIVLMNISLRN